MRHRCLVSVTGASKGLHANVVAKEYQAVLAGKWNKWVVSPVCVSGSREPAGTGNQRDCKLRGLLETY